ncbi:hypothetical protein SNE40_008309 [Patella caerulea]|uniref:Uncharacterized protein n=1 Tax=Patella caerulea TaxID=87958 RepID=A0AAN8K6F8_PATCE
MSYMNPAILLEMCRLYENVPVCMERRMGLSYIFELVDREAFQQFCSKIAEVGISCNEQSTLRKCPPWKNGPQNPQFLQTDGEYLTIVFDINEKKRRCGIGNLVSGLTPNQRKVLATHSYSKSEIVHKTPVKSSGIFYY